MTDVPAVLLSPTYVSFRDPNAIIYDGRPSILPVSISLADLAGDDVVVTVDLPSVIAPPGENGGESGGPTSARDTEPASMSEFSSDTDPDLVDEICRFQPLQAVVSPLSTTSIVGGDDIAVTISGASGARRALGSFLYAGVSGTDLGSVLSWDTGCVRDICSISKCIVLRPDNVAGDSCSNFGN